MLFCARDTIDALIPKGLDGMNAKNWLKKIRYKKIFFYKVNILMFLYNLYLKTSYYHMI